jgi:glycosyltransferase involved in cell wall biosynthesis
MTGSDPLAQSPSEYSLSPFHERIQSRKIAPLLIPCLDEEQAIAKVIRDFRKELPEAEVYVYDNNSSDRTALIAEAAGARVIREKRQGKGFVVASMFEDVEADLYVLVDGDDTYPAKKVHEMLQPLIDERADMVVGNRLEKFGERSFRPFHVLGNKLVVGLVNLIFKCPLRDIISGYRAFNRDFVRKVPIVSRGFEVETEMTFQALHYDFIITEVPVPCRKRTEGSSSKLKTFSDGMKTLLDRFRHFQGLPALAVLLHPRRGIGRYGVAHRKHPGDGVLGDGKDRMLPLCNPGFRDNGYLRHLRRHRDHSRCDQSSSARVDSHPRCSQTAA